MADSKVTALTSAGVVAETDVLYVVRPGDPTPDRKATVSQLRQAVDIKFDGKVKVTIFQTFITVDDTPGELLDENGNRLTISDDTTMTFSALIAARRADANNESAGYKIEGVIDRNAGTVALVGPVMHVALAEDQAAWNVEAVADDVNKALRFNVTGEAGKTIHWQMFVTYAKVTA